ncbi:hypothetical protein CXB49_20510 [Chromobacterium sp. ATCC 53434]|uniref:hypothetical protein n=1 Tax=Chromobacterium sp. (strain ATCC 53434 / SC 14030) TaxID=2059672 RepID=UPI000C783900|nr:hypothetical protein [Chromobacterium sp. ATCC 53434]AUH53000.1 hypothetical protein CXB49_20510 [Chromobacterium sp. ATCC 53434]
MKTTHAARALSALLLLAAGPLSQAQPLAVREDGETAVRLSGTVIGPISSGSKADGTLFKAYHLKLAQPLTLDDGAECGEQDKRSLALNQEDMGRYKGRAITVKAKVFCQTNRTGTYHLSDIAVQ